MEAHSAVPEGDDLGGIGGKDHGVVEQDIAQTPADDDADHDPEGEIEQFVRRHGRVAVGPERFSPEDQHAIADAEENAGQIGQRVPADDDGADGKGYGIDCGEWHVCRSEQVKGKPGRRAEHACPDRLWSSAC